MGPLLLWNFVAKMIEKKMIFESLSQAAKYGRVTRQAVFLAIKKGSLRAEKKLIKGKVQWTITQEDLDDYRAGKNCCEKRQYEGCKLYDIKNNRWSVLHASKAISHMLGRSFPAHRIYYLIRKGEVRVAKYGCSIVISEAAVMDLYEKEKAKEAQRFA
jgi:hypothetical protein